MAKAMDDCKIQFLKTPNEATFSHCTLKVPNFFTLPEYNSTFKASSPSFEIANATWCFQFCSVPNKFKKNKGCDRAFAVWMKRMNSEIPRHFVIRKITLLDADDKRDAGCDNSHLFDDDKKQVIKYFYNDDPSHDNRDELTLVINFIWHGITEEGAYEEPRIKDLRGQMAEEKKDCKISLTMLKKSISTEVFTFKLSNLCTVQERDGTGVEINSPSFEFVNETCCFQFHFETEEDCWYVYILRLDSKRNNIKENPNLKKHIFYLVTSSAKDLEFEGWVYEFEEDEERCELYCFTTNDISPSDTLTIHLFPAELLDMDAENKLSTLEGDVDFSTQDLKELHMDGENSNLALSVAEKDFFVHKNILTHSQVFETMLSHDVIGKKKSAMDVPDFDLRVMSQDEVLGLYNAAAKYKRMFIKDQCTEFIKKSLSPQIICDVIQLALNHNDTDLLECASEYFVNHICDILPTRGWMSLMKLNSIAANKLLIKASKKGIAPNSKLLKVEIALLAVFILNFILFYIF